MYYVFIDVVGEEILPNDHVIVAPSGNPDPSLHRGVVVDIKDKQIIIHNQDSNRTIKKNQEQCRRQVLKFNW